MNNGLDLVLNRFIHKGCYSWGIYHSIKYNNTQIHILQVMNLQTHRNQNTHLAELVTIELVAADVAKQLLSLLLLANADLVVGDGAQQDEGHTKHKEIRITAQDSQIQLLG